MLTRFGQKEMTEVTGKIAMQGQKVRLDVTSPTDMSIIYDQTTKKSVALIHTAKIRLDGGFEQYQDRIPVCVPAQLEACLKKLGLKKTKTETIDQQPCEVYQGKGTRSHKGKTEEYEMTLWHPTQLKDALAIRTLVQMKDGDRIETHFTDIETKPLDASIFVIPKNYVRAGGLEQMLKGLKGFSSD